MEIRKHGEFIASPTFHCFILKIMVEYIDIVFHELKPIFKWNDDFLN
jgi:hypothetical protein